MENGWAKVDSSLTPELFERHLNGLVTLGMYQLNDKGEVKWGCFDFDGVDAEKDATTVYNYLQKTEFAGGTLLEFTGGRGYHVWIFFDNMPQAWHVKEIMVDISKKTGTRCEIFPKQDKVDAGSYGSLVRMPLGKHKKTGNFSRLLQPGDLESIKPCRLEPKEQERDTLNEKAAHDAYPCWLQMMAGVGQGMRDIVAFTLARRLRANFGFDRLLCQKTLLEWNKKNSPPMPEREIITKVRSAYEKEYPNIGCAQIKDSDMLSQFCDEKACPRFAMDNSVIDEISKQVGEEFLRSPDMLAKIKSALDLVLAGEDDTKLLLFILALTCKMESPQFVVVKGESSAGKSYIVNNVLEPFAANGDVIKYSRVTPRAMEYSAADFVGKILFVQELGGIGAQEQFRVWHSEKGLALATVNSEEMKMEDFVIKGTPAFFTTTTQYELDEELETRTWTVSPSESDTQTKMILDFEAQRNIRPGSIPDFAPISAGIMHLKKRDVLIPFADKIPECFETKRVKVRRDFKKVLMLIKAIAFLHQKQRPVAMIDGVEYIVATPLDLRYAIDIGLRFIKNTIVGLPESALQAFDICEEMQLQNREITQESFAMYSGSSKKKKLLDILANAGYLYADEKQKQPMYHVVNSPNLMITVKLQEALERVEAMPFEEICGVYELTANHDVFKYVNPFTGTEQIWVPKRGAGAGRQIS